MNRHFLVPASIAAALHAGLLFGIRPTHASIPSGNPKPQLIDAYRCGFPLIPEPPPPDEGDMSTTKRPHDHAAPALPEPPTPNPASNFEFPVPDVRDQINREPMTTIPVGPFGPPTDLPTGPGVGTGNVLRGTDLDRTPRTRSQTPPAYPFEAKKDGRTGTVTLEFVVDETGAVLTPRITESTDPVFNDSALRAVARWRFEPGRKDGRVVRFRMAVPVVFSLNAE